MRTLSPVAFSSAPSRQSENTMASLRGRVSPLPPRNDAYWFDDEMDDDDGRPISPMSDRNLHRSGTHFLRFFPELSSHFTLASPTIATPQTIDFPRPDSPTEYGLEPHCLPESARQTSSSLSSNELFDRASSCYSCRSSVTSQSSDAGKSASNPTETFSEMSPAVAGVFDDSAPMRHAPHSPLKKMPTLAELKDKPLPLEPIIQLAPLSFRHNARDQPQGFGDRLGDPSTNRMHSGKAKRGHHPTLSQAAEDLENALAGLGDKPLPSSKPLYVLDEPLQISRGNMDMIPTRRAPPPPIDVQRSQQLRSAKSREDLKPKKTPKNKAPFSFTLPGFGRKANRLDTRSPSSCDMRSEAGSPSPVVREEVSTPTKFEERYNSMELPVFMKFESPPPPPPPSSFYTSEQELRLQLPRLQTDEIEGMYSRSPSRAGNMTNGSTSPAPILILERDQDDAYEEKIFISSSKDTHSNTNGASYDQETMQILDMIYELDGDYPELRVDPAPAISVRGSLVTMPANLPDKIVLTILEQACSLPDLFHLAVVCKQFYRIFKDHELRLMKSVVFTMSPPAWELREMSPAWDSEWQILVDPDAPVPDYTPSLYLQRYAQDIFTLVQIKGLILARCDTFVRPETKGGLLGTDESRAMAIDDAFWRIWTFCRLFGCGKNREGDIVGQLDWIDGGIAAMDRRTSTSMSVTDPFGTNSALFDPPDGFAEGNKCGLSQDQLYDMTEMWTCMGVLLQPLHGKCREARDAGIFDGHGVPENDAVEEAVLEEWTYYVLSLGPSAVLNIGLTCSTGNVTEAFQKARSLGLTKWELDESGVGRSNFLKEAVSRAYRPREDLLLGTSRLSKDSSRPSSSRGHHSRASTDSNGSKSQIPNHRRRQAVYAEQLRNRRRDQQGHSSHALSNERPISNYGVIMNHLEGQPHERLPPLAASGERASPRPSSGEQYTQRLRVPRPVASSQPQVRDPVDQAIDMMVGELGFNVDDAKWALKITDTGEGIDVNSAVALLMRGHRNCELNRDMSQQSQPSSLLSTVMASPASGWRWT